MTANQLVAYNLRRARELRGLTQEQAAEQLEPYLGRRWSKATFSAAETSVTSGRTREFSADEILAFSAAFAVPPGWFYLPPPEGDALREDVTAGGPEGIDAKALIDIVAPASTSDMTSRLIELHLEDPALREPGLEAAANAAFMATIDPMVEEARRRLEALVSEELAKFAAPTKARLAEIQQRLDTHAPRKRARAAADASRKQTPPRNQAAARKQTPPRNQNAQAPPRKNTEARPKPQTRKGK